MHADVNSSPGDLVDRAARVLFETPITFEVVDQLVHCPMVHANVRGTLTKLILDTGSTAHVLTIELANAAGLPSKPDVAGMDHAGAPVPSWSLGEVPITIERFALPLRSVVAIEGPSPFLRWGVGGFLSPQNLHSAAFAVIDLLGNTLILVEGDASDIASWARLRFPTLKMLSLQREPGEGVFVDAAVAPFETVKTMLNTGTGSTEFAIAAVPGLRGTPPESTGLGVSGAEVHGEEASGHTLRVGDATFSIPVLFVREAMPPEHGLGQVGMDVLRGTVLVVSANEDKPVFWLVPTRDAG